MRKAVLLMALLIGCTYGAYQGKDHGVSKNLKKKSDFHYKLARNYLDVHNVPMALKELKDALKYNPDNADAHHLRGFIMFGRGNYVEAESEFKKTLKIDPRYYPARNNLGSLYIAMGRYKDAIRVLRPLLEEELYPTPYLAEGNIGWAYYKLGKYEKAALHLQRAVLLNPKFCLGFNNLGMVLYAMKHYNDAIASFKQAVKVCKKYAEPYYHMGVTYESLGEFNKSVEAFRQCMKVGGDSKIGGKCRARLGVQ